MGVFQWAPEKKMGLKIFHRGSLGENHARQELLSPHFVSLQLGVHLCGKMLPGTPPEIPPVQIGHMVKAFFGVIRDNDG